MQTYIKGHLAFKAAHLWFLTMHQEQLASQRLFITEVTTKGWLFTEQWV